MAFRKSAAVAKLTVHSRNPKWTSRHEGFTITKSPFDSSSMFCHVHQSLAVLTVSREKANLGEPRAASAKAKSLAQ